MTEHQSPLARRDAAVLASAEHIRFFPLAAVEGRGALLFEESGRRLVDLSGGWSAAGVGYAHPKVVAAVSNAAAVMPGSGVLSGTHPYAVELAERLIALMPLAGQGERAVYLGLSGSDANSAVIRAVRAWSARPGLLSFAGSYHGGLGPAQDASGFSAEGSGLPGLRSVPYGDTEAALAEIRRGDLAAVLVEPILSDGGLVIPERGFLPALRRACDETGTLLVVDEVKVGLGRTGQLLAHQSDGVVADIVTLGKSLGGGLPLSAAIGPREVMDAAPGSTVLTLAGNPVCCAAGLAVLDILAEEELPRRAARSGTILSSLLEKLRDSQPLVASVRSRGLVGGIELRCADGSAATPQTAKVVYRAYQLGVVIYYVGTESNVLEITPPLVIDEVDLRWAIGVVGQAIADVVAGLVSDEEVAGYAGW